MLDRRERNINVFRDTEKLYQTNERLKDAVRKSIDEQKLILSDDAIVYENVGRKDGTVLVSGKRTLEAAEAYARKGKRVCVLNFASATNPGGGVVNVKITGKKEIVSIKIDPEVIDPDDAETLEDLIVAAVNEAIKKVEAISAEEMSKITGSMNLPAGMF